MTRREAREAAFQIIFSLTINDNDVDDVIIMAKESEEFKLDEFAERLIRTTVRHRAEIDEIFSPYLKGWDLKRISKVSLAIFRLSCAQLFYWNEIDDEPMEDNHRMVINESVQLSKEFGTDVDYIYINGVLGSITHDLIGKG